MADVAEATLSPSEQAILESGRPQPMTDAAPVDERPTPPHAIEEQRERRRTYTREHGRKAAASPDDLPAIRSLAALVKELTPANDADAPRVKELRSKVRAALELDSPKPEPKAEPAVKAEPAPITPPAPFTDKEPTLDDFVGKADDPYAAQVRAAADFDRRKAEHDRQQAETDRLVAARQEADAQAWQRTVDDHNQRVTKAAEKYPDWQTVVTGKQATPMLNHAIIAMPNGEEATWFLAHNPDLLTELNLQSLALPSHPTSVGLLQQRISSRMAAGSTGAAPARPVLVAPRPPTPVRTGPMRASVDRPPGDDDDLSAHRQAYGVGGSRRRR